MVVAEDGGRDKEIEVGEDVAGDTMAGEVGKTVYLIRIRFPSEPKYLSDLMVTIVNPLTIAVIPPTRTADTATTTILTTTETDSPITMTMGSSAVSNF